MSERRISYEEIAGIVELIRQSGDFAELRLKVGDIEVELRRAAPPGAAPPPPAVPAGAAAPNDDAARAPAPGAGHAGDAGYEPPPGAHVVRAPMVGTFYRAPQPGAAPFVEVGQRVAAGDIVCIIEVMKLMNSIAAGVAGTVTDVLVENGGGVEYGQPLIVIAPG
jgi:acetyl-CoA carboxylase biotin carboxyl carrier protein